jgi:hypothetical protein
MRLRQLTHQLLQTRTPRLRRRRHWAAATEPHFAAEWRGRHQSARVARAVLPMPEHMQRHTQLQRSVDVAMTTISNLPHLQGLRVAWRRSGGAVQQRPAFIRNKWRWRSSAVCGGLAICEQSLHKACQATGKSLGDVAIVGPAQCNRRSAKGPGKRDDTRALRHIPPVATPLPVSNARCRPGQAAAGPNTCASRVPQQAATPPLCAGLGRPPQHCRTPRAPSQTTLLPDMVPRVVRGTLRRASSRASGCSSRPVVLSLNYARERHSPARLLAPVCTRRGGDSNLGVHTTVRQCCGKETSAHVSVWCLAFLVLLVA